MAKDLDFSHEVVPILKQHCIECHGGKEAKGSFSLNTRELLADSGHIDKDAPAESELLKLVKSSDAEYQMPPKEKPRLSAKEILTLEKWIAANMPWEAGFWFAPQAYEPPLHPRRPELPSAIAGCTNPIDRILDQWLKSQGIATLEPIDDAAFLRRVRLD